MQGTVPRKIARLVGDFIRHPQYISRCLQHNLINGKTPLDLEIPWFSYSAVDFLSGFLLPHMTVFEYGSGGSTLFFARRVNSVLSIEDNPAWCERVTSRLEREFIRNVNLRLLPFDFKKPDGFEASLYLRAIEEGRFDVIIIDGSEEWIYVRPICFEKAEKYVAPGGIIVVDDSWRYLELRQRNHARGCRIFQSVGPCRPGVTSTDVFFY
jgi:hypothetical protein